jgi:RNA polymerase sigma factor (sigma-70 family)
VSANAIGATPDSTPLEELTDVDLLDRVRHGDDDAFVVLWRRHLPAAQAVATRFRGRVAPEDLVAEASARMLRLLREGAGPRDNFRAYFTSTVRTVGVDAVRRDMSALPTDAADLDRVAGTDGEDEPDEDLGSGLVRAAFARLPERERQLLWMTMVDGAAPRAVAPRLGVSANLVSVRVMRAKEALRGHYLDVWVQQRSTECASAECRWTLDHLSAHVRGRSTPRRQAKVEAHLASCPRDAAIADNLRRINTGFAGLILPFLVAGASQAFGAGVGQGAGGLLATGAGLGGVSGVGTGAAGGAASAGAAGASGAAGAAGAAAGGGAAASTAGGAAAASSAVAATASAAGAVGTTTAGAAAASTAGLAASGAVASGAVASGASVVGAAAVGVTAVGAAALVPVAVAAGGATIGGLTISPPVATAVAGLVLGLGVAAPAVVLTHGTNEHTVVQQHQSSSPVHTPPPAGVGPSQLPDLGSAAGGALGGAVVAPVVSATVPVALTASAAAAAAPAPTSTAAPSPSDTATATASPSPDPSAAATDPAPSAPAPDPAPTASPTAPADQQSAPAPAGVVGSGDTATAPAPSGATPAGAPASDSGSGATAAPASGG